MVVGQERVMTVAGVEEVKLEVELLVVRAVTNSILQNMNRPFVVRNFVENFHSHTI